MGAALRKARRIRHGILIIVAVIPLALIATVASAAVISGPDIIPAPSSAADTGGAVNDHQQAFAERQGIVLAAPLETDSGFIPTGTRVNSHMIFLNQTDGVSDSLSSLGVVWTFDGPILGVMSDNGGTLEAQSNAILGAPGTFYPGALIRRGLEVEDEYSVFGSSITVSMNINQPGDWIRVVTLSLSADPPNQVPVSVGGSTTFISENSGSSGIGMAALVSAATAFVLAAGCGWYAKRRWFSKVTA